MRRVYSCAFAFLKKKKILEFSLFVPSEGKETVRAIVDGMELSDYSFQKYRKAEAEDSEHILSCFLHVSSQLTSDLAVWTLIARQTKYARDLINANASELYPEVLVGELSSFCEKENLEYEVLDEKELEKERMNLLLAVGSGSVHPPRLALASYRGNPDSDEYVALVGKGITFDTGGVNLKPTGYVEAMKCDMAGAAVALSVFQAAVKLTFRCNLVLVLSSAENALSGSSYLPGDVLRARSGLGVEILNTDAEGRLVLADAFDYVQEKWKVKILVDLATLTGACLVALGPKLIALLGNDVALKKALFDAGETVYEQTWELPIYEEHQEAIKGTFGNIKNQGGKYGGVSTAAAFLQAFVRDGFRGLILILLVLRILKRQRTIGHKLGQVVVFAYFWSGSRMFDFFKKEGVEARFSTVYSRLQTDLISFVCEYTDLLSQKVDCLRTCSSEDPEERKLLLEAFQEHLSFLLDYVDGDEGKALKKLSAFFLLRL